MQFCLTRQCKYCLQLLTIVTFQIQDYSNSSFDEEFISWSDLHSLLLHRNEEILADADYIFKAEESQCTQYPALMHNSGMHQIEETEHTIWHLERIHNYKSEVFALNCHDSIGQTFRQIFN